jgi:hypothetical protein
MKPLTSRNWATGLSYLYLILPFVIFSFGWYRLPVALVVCVVLVWVLYQIFRSFSSETTRPLQSRWLFAGIALLGIWVFLSGIGGYTFQNHDFHHRNAVFRDLIQYNWPVFYPPDTPAGGAENGQQPMELVYYLGFWLPAALGGKMFGWTAGNFLFFLWSWLGVFLVTQQMSFRLKISLWWSVLLLIFFSGMDALGVVAMRAVFPPEYPTLWPPIQHLEWWAYIAQYSSFTTQLTTVFNQSIPSWLCMILLINGIERRHVFFLWSLCFFFSPLPALGMIPFVALKVLQAGGESSSREKGGIARQAANFIWSSLTQIKAMISLENILGGGCVAGMALLYLSTNQMTGTTMFHAYPGASILLLGLFCLFEWALLWALLYPMHYQDCFWYLTGAMLVLVLFIQVGIYQDFELRASIPALFYLMIMAGDTIRREEILPRKERSIRYAVTTCLLIGALTPLFEINRSIYRAADYDTCHFTTFFRPCAYPGIASTNIFDPFTVETDHPHSLVADDLKSFANFAIGEQSNFLTQPEYSGLSRLLLKGAP